MHRSIRLSGRLLFPVAAGFALLLASAAISAQERTTLRKVEILGLQRRSPDQVIATSGLKVGDLIDASMIDAAAARLMRSGWFQSVDYRVRTADNDTTVIFEVVEKVAATNSPAAETLGQVAWNGNTVLSNDELANAFGLRAGELASKAKLDQALDRVRKAYARRGYIDVKLKVTGMPDVALRRTNYEYIIYEGRQFRMGTLSITGLPAAETNQLRSKWTLAGGSVFDDSYVEEFRTTILRPFVAGRVQRTGIRSTFEVDIKPDTQKHTVDVIIAFK